VDGNQEQAMTTVAEVMTRDVRTMGPNDSVVDAARCMDELNVGVIPVCEGDKLVGIVTATSSCAASPSKARCAA
jgi:CBS domain-containing protein